MAILIGFLNQVGARAANYLIDRTVEWYHSPRTGSGGMLDNEWPGMGIFDRNLENNKSITFDSILAEPDFIEE